MLRKSTLLLILTIALSVTLAACSDDATSPPATSETSNVVNGQIDPGGADFELRLQTAGDAQNPFPGPASAFRERFEQRPIFGLNEPAMEADATVGGWIRPSPDRGGDALLLSTLSDSWRPAVFSKRMPGKEHRGVPTIELTVHFRAPTVTAAIQPGAYYLVRFRTRMARDGYVEEDGEIWSERGVLLAQSRQLALFA